MFYSIQGISLQDLLKERWDPLYNTECLFCMNNTWTCLKNSWRIFFLDCCLKVLIGSHLSKEKRQSGKNKGKNWMAFLILCLVIIILQKALKWNRWMLRKCVSGVKSTLISKYTLLCVTGTSPSTPKESFFVCVWCQLTYSSWGFGSAFVRLLPLLLGFCSLHSTSVRYDGNREYSPLQTKKYI